MFNKESKIDELAWEKRDLVLQREKLVRDMRARNSKRETKIKVLENACTTDYDETQKKVVELDRKISKLVRNIDSEQIYVNEVANAEKSDYLKEKKDEADTKAKVKSWAKKGGE